MSIMNVLQNNLYNEFIIESLQGESMAQVGNLSKKIAKRVYAKAIKDLRALHTNTKEAVEKLFASVNLVSLFAFIFFLKTLLI